MHDHSISQKQCLKKSNNVNIILTQVAFSLNKPKILLVAQSSDLCSSARSDAATSSCCRASTTDNSFLLCSNSESLSTLPIGETKVLFLICVRIISSVEATPRSTIITTKTGDERIIPYFTTTIRYFIISTQLRKRSNPKKL